MIQQAKLAYDQGYVHFMRDHHRLIVNTHTIEADFTATNNTVTFSLFAPVWCMMLCAASSAGISRLHNWYFVLSMITYCPQNFTRQAGVYISNFYSPDDKFTRHWRAGEC